MLQLKAEPAEINTLIFDTLCRSQTHKLSKVVDGLAEERGDRQIVCARKAFWCR
jgi:hypothetical protein